jgi:hypothetical protein
VTGSGNSAKWWEVASGDEVTVGDQFAVWIGPVVDNRDEYAGNSYPFATARDLPRRGTIGMPERTRQFSGRVFSPPFVVIRRTSRPSDGAETRASGVLISGLGSVAVDNHLIVLCPRDGKENTCEELLRVLNSESTTKFLDQRLRCRHLTAGAVKEIPWI